MTFVEGKRLTYFAEVIANNTAYTKEEVLKVASDKTFLESLINKYWFITNDILNNKIYYPLEGYLFPDTYSFKKDASIEDILITLVASLGKKLEPYKTFEYYLEKVQTELDLQEENDEGEEVDSNENVIVDFDPERTHDMWEESDEVDEKTLNEFTEKFADSAQKGKNPNSV